MARIKMCKIKSCGHAHSSGGTDADGKNIPMECARCDCKVFKK